MPALKDIARDQAGLGLETLRALVRQPSVAATGEGVAECAALVRRTFEDAGARVQVYTRIDAPPLIVAEFPGAGDR
ncbi:MAG: hypothetical protein QN123_07480, partial [Armatimonadota bacterium]|nr:hypothetical protein [Armatimonadota bacterium]